MNAFRRGVGTNRTNILWGRSCWQWRLEPQWLSPCSPGGRCRPQRPWAGSPLPPQKIGARGEGKESDFSGGGQAAFNTCKILAHPGQARVPWSCRRCSCSHLAQRAPLGRAQGRAQGAPNGGLPSRRAGASSSGHSALRQPAARASFSVANQRSPLVVSTLVMA